MVIGTLGEKSRIENGKCQSGAYRLKKGFPVGTSE